MPTNYEALKLGEQKRKRAGVFLRCETCREEFYVMPSRLRQAQRQNATVRYCSMSCYDKTGAKNPSYGRKHSAESIRKMSEHPNRPRFSAGPDNPNFIRFGADYKHQHARRLRERLLRERGRRCERCGYDDVAEVLEIHHKDRNRKNNSRGNLGILCPTCHAVDHFRKRDGSYNRIGAKA